MFWHFFSESNHRRWVCFQAFKSWHLDPIYIDRDCCALVANPHDNCKWWGKPFTFIIFSTICLLFDFSCRFFLFHLSYILYVRHPSLIIPTLNICLCIDLYLLYLIIYLAVSGYIRDYSEYVLCFFCKILQDIHGNACNFQANGLL